MKHFLPDYFKHEEHIYLKFWVFFNSFHAFLNFSLLPICGRREMKMERMERKGLVTLHSACHVYGTGIVVEFLSNII